MHGSLPAALAMGVFDFFKRKPVQSGAASAGPRLAELLIALSDRDPKVRLAACRELGAMGRGAADAGERLQELLDDEDGDVCNAAAAALSDIER